LAQKLPHAFDSSLEQNFKPKLAWLQKRLMLDDTHKSQLGHATHAFAACFHCGNEHGAHCKACEECVGSGAGRKIVASSPRLFASNLEKWLKPRLAEFQENARKLVFSWMRAQCDEQQNDDNGKVVDQHGIPKDETVETTSSTTVL
jgi:hypothetical protein